RGQQFDPEAQRRRPGRDRVNQRVSRLRTGTYFSTPPFIGAVLAIAIFGEEVTIRLVSAGALMAIGLYLHLSEAHEHEHEHEVMEHEHRHVHDAHHRHEHSQSDPVGEPHSHWHSHIPLRHKHPHYPDLHHRHRRSDEGPLSTTTEPFQPAAAMTELG